MSDTPIDLVIPIYNEGESILKLFEKFQSNIKTPFRVLLCYDNDNDDIFNFQNKFKEFNFEIQRKDHHRQLKGV